ncbi:hypothetical protein [Variovorax sp. GB1P17]|uniref:hypothetical protein n=1 Tax=Variovorax sp. GB1P17 TaxID=3443740 RepID=UPI003F44B168
MSHSLRQRARQTMAGAMLIAASLSPSAHELFNADGSTLNADLSAVYALINSQRNYDGREGGSHWREGFLKYGLSGSTARIRAGTLYGGFNLVSSATWGDGDAGGLSDGTERRTSIEDAFVGWRSSDLFPTLGTNGFDLSVGRQAVKIGNGFLVMDDGLNPGRRVAGSTFDRGGAYYLAARHAFSGTTVLRLGGDQGLHGSAMWLKSSNRAQANTELAAGTLEHTSAAGTLGLTYIRGLDVDPRYASDAQRLRKGMDVYSLRGEGSAGLPNTSLAFEVARQDTRQGSATAWYGQAGYTFADWPWSPTLTYRYARYGQTWDSLFTGGFRGWLQGEVAGNYAGPFNTNAGVHHVSLGAKPTEILTLGVLFFDFRTLRERQTLALDARELNLFAEWAVHEHLIVMPMVGLYKPRRYAGHGGNQSGNAATNVYAQLLLIAPF